MKKISDRKFMVGLALIYILIIAFVFGIASYNAHAEGSAPQSPTKVYIKNYQWFNIKDFGAVGDSLTDDGAVIQTVLDSLEALGGGTMYMPKGVYRTTYTMMYGSNLHIQGSGAGTKIYYDARYGAALHATSPGGCAFLSKSHDTLLTTKNVLIENFTLETPDTVGNGIGIVDGENITIRNITSHEIQFHLVDMTGDFITVENCYMKGFTSTAMQIDNRSSTFSMGREYSNHTVQSTPIAGKGDVGGYGNRSSSNITISNNRFDSCFRALNVHRIGGHNVSIIGNTFNDCRTGIYGDNGAYLAEWRGLNITGNTFHAPMDTNSAHIQLYYSGLNNVFYHGDTAYADTTQCDPEGDETCDSAGVRRMYEDLVIANNTFVGGQSAITVSNANVIIEGNTIDSMFHVLDSTGGWAASWQITRGITLHKSTGIISNNLIRNIGVGQDTSGWDNTRDFSNAGTDTTMGIDLQKDTGVVVVNNFLENIYGIGISAGVDVLNFTISGNYIKNSGIGVQVKGDADSGVVSFNTFDAGDFNTYGIYDGATSVSVEVYGNKYYDGFGTEEDDFGSGLTINWGDYTLPLDAGTDGQILKINGSQVVDWAADDGGGGGTADSIYFNTENSASGTEYKSINNLVKIRPGSNITITREDSTTFDLIRISASAGSGAFDNIDGGLDTARYVAPNGDTIIIFTSDETGNALMRVGKESDNSAITLRIKVDTLDINGDVIMDFAGNNLSVSSGVLVVAVLDTTTTTVNHTQWDEFIKDQVGDMVSGNTESEITVTYQEADNTIDFTVTSDKDIVATSPLTVNGGASLDDVIVGSDADITIAIADADDDGTTKGASTYDNGDFDATAGLISIPYVDQDVTSGSAPTFDATNITGIATGTVEHTHINVRAGTGTIPKGNPIYATSYNASGFYVVEIADAGNVAKMPAIGVADVAITTGATVDATTFGRMTGQNTDTITGGIDGSLLYVASGGGLTVTKPTGTDLIQQVGMLGRDHASQGVIQVVGAGRTNDIPNIASANFWLGNGSAVATAVTMSSEATMDNTGAVTLDNDALDDQYLELAGGTMAGNIVMGNNDMTGVAEISSASIILSSGITLNTIAPTTWNTGDNIDGEIIADGTIDDDALDFADITLDDFDYQTAWRVFYSNTDGDVTELALGADGTYLKSNGATSAPTFATPAGSGDMSKVGTPVDNQVGIWTGDGTMEGSPNFTFDGNKITADSLLIDSIGVQELDVGGSITVGGTVDGTDIAQLAGRFDTNYTQITLATVLGAVDLGGATSLELPNGNNPTTDAEGEIAWDANDDAIEAFSGTENESVLIPIYKHISIPLVLPDSIATYVPNFLAFHVHSLLYPFGIEIDLVSIQLESDAAYSMVIEEWSGADPPVLQNIISTVITGGADTYAEEAPDNDAVIDVGDWIVLNIPTTDVDIVTVEIYFHIYGGN